MRAWPQVSAPFVLSCSALRGAPCELKVLGDLFPFSFAAWGELALVYRRDHSNLVGEPPSLGELYPIIKAQVASLLVAVFDEVRHFGRVVDHCEEVEEGSQSADGLGHTEDGVIDLVLRHVPSSDGRT